MFKRVLRKLVRRGGSLFLVFCISSLWAQVERRQKAEPDSEFDSVPFSSVIRDQDPGADGLFRRIKVGPSVEPSIGAGGQVDITGPSIRAFTNPFLFGGKPEDAEFKAGPFYLDIRSVSGGILYSDNILRSEVNAEEDVIAILRLHMTALLQLTDNLRLAVSGILVYLPFEGEFGIAGRANDFFARFDFGPLGRAQVSYDLKLGDWEVLFFNELTLRNIRAVEGIGFDYFDFDEEDRAGRYVYRQQIVRRNERGLDDAFVTIHNVVGVTATTVLPTVTRFTVGADHQNFWYIDRPSAANLPATRDQIYASLVSERETTRFKPYLTFRTWITDIYDDWRREAHLGFFGPISENLHVRCDVGYGSDGRRFSRDVNEDSLLWLFRLVHTPRPQIHHWVEYSKRITEFEDDLSESLSYHLRYRFSDDFFTELYGVRAKYEDADTDFVLGESEEYRVGVRLTYDIAQRTTFRIGTVFTQIERERPSLPDFDKWTSRAELLYRYSATLHARLLYQHEIRDSDMPLDSYEENLVMLTLTKYF